MNKKKQFDPLNIIKDINCMFFGACNKKQVEDSEND